MWHDQTINEVNYYQISLNKEGNPLDGVHPQMRMREREGRGGREREGRGGREGEGGRGREGEGGRE